jgi:DNA-binding NarL/FixJ family response regulator
VEPSKVLIADSQPLCRGGLSAILQRSFRPQAIIEAHDFESMLAAIACDPDIGLVAMDLGLPGMHALEGLRHLRRSSVRVRIMVIAWSNDRSHVLNALAAGANGYIPKTLTASAMLDAFRVVIAGHTYVPTDMSDQENGPALDNPMTAKSTPALTSRQREVLERVAAGDTNKQIARSLRIAESTVKVHVTAAFRLLGVHNRIGAVTALQGSILQKAGLEQWSRQGNDRF